MFWIFYQICFKKYVFSVCGCHFILLTVCFTEQKILILKESNISFFPWVLLLMLYLKIHDKKTKVTQIFSCLPLEVLHYCILLLSSTITSHVTSIMSKLWQEMSTSSFGPMHLLVLNLSNIAANKTKY